MSAARPFSAASGGFLLGSGFLSGNVGAFLIKTNKIRKKRNTHIRRFLRGEAGAVGRSAGLGAAPSSPDVTLTASVPVVWKWGKTWTARLPAAPIVRMKRGSC